jgi:hypothetical protein
MAVKRAEKELEAIQGQEELKGRITRIENFIMMAPKEIDRRLKQFEDMPLRSYELKFYY